MKRIVFAMLSIIMLLSPVMSFGATGHAPGCTNTGYDTSCCTKEFDIGVESGYNLKDVLVNGISQGPITSYTFGELTEDSTIEVITEKIEPVLATANGAWYTQGGTSIAKNSITSITLVNSYTPAGTVVASWDASKGQQGTITAYVESDGTGNGTYKLTIAGNEYGYIKADTSCKNAFSNFEKITTLTGTDILDTSDVTDMSYMFYAERKLTNLDVSTFNTSKVTTMEKMFSALNEITNLKIKGINTSNVNNMNGMFWGCSDIESIDVTGFITSNVTDMASMFSACINLKNINVSSFNTSNVTAMMNMFGDCHALTSIDLSNFNTNKVTNMNSMFFMCRALTNIDVSNFNTSNVTDMGGMFAYCENLISIDVSNFNTSKVTDMSMMFECCNAATSINVSGLNTSNVTDMYEMFYACSSLTSLDLSSFNTSKVNMMWDMFTGMNKLEEITLGVNFSFKGDGSVTDCVLPTPNSTYISGADGKWYNAQAVGYTPANVPNNVAATYYAAKRLLPVMYGDADNNGIVDMGDATLVLQYIEGQNVTINLINSDVNIDGVVNKYDLAPITEYSILNTEGFLPYNGKVVIFEGNGDDQESSLRYQLFEIGETKALKKFSRKGFSRENYAFNGWSTTSTGAVEYTDGASYTANSNITLYAVWGLYGDANDDGTVDMDDMIAIKEYVEGSTTEINLINADVNLDGIVNEFDRDIVLRYVLNAITTLPYISKGVLYKSNDELEGSLTQFATEGSTITLKGTRTFEGDEYVINGWSTTPTGGVEYQPGASYTITENITLYAVWGLYGDANNNGSVTTVDANKILEYVQGNVVEINLVNADVNKDSIVDKYDAEIILSYLDGSIESLPYTGKIVMFESNGGTGSMSRQAFTTGETKALTTNAFTRDGYTFSGWATTSTGSVAYANGASYTANSNITLYAVWTINTYTVTFNKNGGSGTMNPQTFTAGVAQNLTANAFTRSGRTFKGWATSSTGNVAYANGASYTATANVTLYARWHCTTCGGDGTVYGTCTSCNGQGGEYSDCSKCGGTGEYGTQTCTHCGGSAWVECSDCDGRNCRRCDGEGGWDCGCGNGREPKECTACDGTGDDSWSRCYSCSGNGKRENTCTKCSGSGVAS